MTPSAKAVAAHYRQAVDLRRILEEVLSSLEPYVKDWRRFLRWIDTSLRIRAQEGPEDVFTGFSDPWDLVNTKVVKENEISLLVSGNPLGDDWVESHHMVPSEISGTIVVTQDLRTWPRRFTQKARVHLSDPRGFQAAFAEILTDKESQWTLAKLGADSLRAALRLRGTEVIEEQASLMEILGEVISDEIRDIDYTHDVASVKALRSKGYPKGNVLRLECQAILGIAYADVKHGEQYYDG